MTALLWMLAWLPQVLLAVIELPQPVVLNLNSSHFIHMLEWEPGPGTPTGVYYQVTVNTEMGTSWVPVVGCEHVQHSLVCSLTKAFSDPKQVYFTKITALLEAQHSQAGLFNSVIHGGFQPIKDTQLDLPRLTVTPCGQDLCVDLLPPMEHLKEIYDSLHYKLRVKSKNADRAQFSKDTKSLRRVILKDLASDRQYCVSVCFSGRDSLVQRESNYSQPVCAFTPAHYTADTWISASLCLLVICAVVVVALLVYTGFICLKRRPLPSVLASIQHKEELLVVSSHKTSLLSVLIFKPTAPSAGERRSSQTSVESDEESVTESTGWSRGGGYKLQVGNNLTSSSSSTLSAPLSLQPQPPPSFSSNQTFDFFVAEAEPSISTETRSDAGLKEPLSTHTASHSDSDPCPADTDCLTAGRKVVGEGGSQDVNLLTLTFGRHGDGEKSHFDTAGEPEMDNTSQIRDTEEVAIETDSCSGDDEEEHSGYKRR
ncbi:interferon alpha/beta receptor 2-like [Cottoperca gobio]|uniref:Interferon alpha/beta receptor 2-like n=1 Tax=Cottoperca gobio TaxID=56716 RepID=A0A6J2RWY8_COTGO|nr:interferon alpha/beta receptor 2-like [Cottoperca gobio]XP_029314460.1 interferon alpha/beta receptor 2-like [Cottoperca gobio]